MNPAEKLLLEAMSIVRARGAIAACDVAAREATSVDIANLARSSQDRAHILFAVRSTIMATAITHAAARPHLVEALQSLVNAAKARPTSKKFLRQIEDVPSWWLESDR